MFKFIFNAFQDGFNKVKNNTQLIFTIITAIIIVIAFIFTTERFIKIANDAQERLINVRVGSLQDAFVPFAVDKLNDKDYLNQKINEVLKNNETIRTFRIIIKEKLFNEELNKDIFVYKIIASNNTEELNQDIDLGYYFFNLASLEPSSSITLPITSNDERLFQTTRAILNINQEIVGVITTTQTLSQADLTIQKNIENSKFLLLFVVILIIFLFFRQSKIIDYIDLYKKLKEIDKLKDDFVSMASHELKTPLFIIKGYADFIKDAPELLPETRENVSKIEISVNQLNSLINEILDVSMIEQGRMNFEYKELNPKELIVNIADSFALNAKEKNLNISFDFSKAADGQLISVDENKLRQVLINLIGNAVKYTNKGEVIIKQYVEKNRLYIRVSDTGIGMSSEEKERLFEKFYRIRNEDTQSIRGTGLGLWITAKIVKEMKGDISVESIKGVGSHFVIYFPIINSK